MIGDQGPFQMRKGRKIGSCPLSGLSFPSFPSFLSDAANIVEEEKRSTVENIKKVRNLRIILKKMVIASYTIKA